LILTYKYRLKDRSVKKMLRRHAAAANQVWNWAVAQQRDVEHRYRAGEKPRKWSSHFDLAKQCKGVGKELGIHQQSVQGICRQFTESRAKLRHAPSFRASFGPKRALGWLPFQQQSRQIEGNSIWYLGKRYRWFGHKRRPLPKNANGGCFVEDASGKWYVCFQVEVNNLPTGSGEVGIDLGLKTLATLSDGTKVERLAHYRRWQVKLARAQRSGNKRRVRAIHARIANARRDYLHKTSCHIARQHALIAVGNVNSSRLATARMAKSVLDAGWSTFRNMLRYKASRHGASYVEVDEAFTTQTCSSCGALPPKRPKGIAGLGIRAWDCPDCGTSHDRDVNAARNILRLGRSAPPPVEESWRGARSCGRGR
jgi:putative transposase